MNIHIQKRRLAGTSESSARHVRLMLVSGWWWLVSGSRPRDGLRSRWRVNQKATLDLDFAPVLIVYHYPSLASNILGGVCAARTLEKRRAIISPIPERHVEAVISKCPSSIRLLALS